MSDPTGRQNPLQKLGPKGVSSIVLAALVVVFIVENSAKTKIRFIAGPKISAPLWLALLITAAVGALAGWLLEKRRKRD